MPDRGMGKGLSALLSEREAAANGGELRELPLDLIKPNPKQPRDRLGQAELDALAESIEKQGVIQPVLVRPLIDGNYQLIAGERRWRAAQKAGLEKIPAVLRGDIVEGKDRGRDSLELALVENVIREDLNAIEMARACARLADEFGMGLEDVGIRVGRSRSAVSNLIRLLDLPDEVQHKIASGAISEGHGRAILQLQDQKLRKQVAKMVIERELSVRQTESHVKAIGNGRDTGTGKGRAKVELHPELEQLRQQAEDSLRAALGTDLIVRISGKGAKVEILLDSLDQAFQLAERVRLRQAA